MLQRTPVFSRAGGLLCVLGTTFSLVTTASSAAEDQVVRETARPLQVDPSIPPQKDLAPVAVTLRKMSKTHEGPADVSAKSSLLSEAIPPAGGGCDLECDWCWCGTEFENNCPNEWFLDADCDCGCQFCDAGCFDCELQDCGRPLCGPECLFCWIGTKFENNCPLSWCGDSECDCGCQFTDSDCPGGTCECNSVCGNGICECECDETLDTCPSDCIAVPCAAGSAIELGVGEEYGLAGEMCVETIASCPCEAACEFCNDGNCNPAWNGDGVCDCGCQFCDIDCVGVVDCCIPGPSPAEVCVQVFPPALGSVSCPEPLTCIGDDPTCGTSVLDPGTGSYLFCPTYTSADVGDACVRLWIEEPDSSCDPELWWRFNQVCSCGNGFCEAGCGESCTNCQEDCGCGTCDECVGGICQSCCEDGDSDQDGDTDLYDFAFFQRCFDPSPPVSAECEVADLDCDYDVDLDDYSIWLK